MSELAEALLTDAPSPMTVLTSFSSAAYPTPYSVHANVAAGMDSSTDVRIVGFGANDGLPSFPSAGYRLTGIMRLAPTWDFSYLHGVVDCDNHVVAHLPTSRLSLVRTSATGAITDVGDSGGPALLEGGTGAGQVPGLATGIKYIMGVASGGGGSGCSGGGAPLDGGMNCTAFYAPTYSPFNGEWLDSRLVDFDGDGFKDWEDMCPTVASTDNADSNFDAEYKIAIANSEWAYGSDTHTPTISDWETNQAYSKAWHSVFRGDACDADSVSASQPSFSFENGEDTSCDVYTVYQMGGMKSTASTSGTGCKRLLNTGMTSAGYIGGAWGTAPPVNGTAQPAYCACAKATPRECDNSADLCEPANDGAFPYLPFPAPSNWFVATRRSNSGADSTYVPFGIKYQDPSTVNVDFGSNETVATRWNFRSDISGFSAAVVFWTHVTNFAPVYSYENGLSENYPGFDRNNHYFRVNASSKNGEKSVSIPVNINLFVPIWLQVTRSPSLVVPWLLATSDALSGQARLFLQDDQRVSVLNSNEITASASSVLAAVANGSVLVPADDVLPGALPEDGYAAIVVDVGTAQPSGALRASSDGRIDGILATPTVADTPVLVAARAFASRRDTIFSLRAGGSGQFELASQTLSEALRSTGGAAVTTISITGSMPAVPRAMAWNNAEGVLFVLDAMPDGGGNYSLRLLRLTLEGHATELWRLRKDVLPSSMFLATGGGGEVVLTLGIGSDTEVLVMDGFGTPLQSLRSSDAVPTGPAVLNRAGLSQGYQPHLPNGHLGGFKVVLTARKDMTTCRTRSSHDDEGEDSQHAHGAHGNGASQEDRCGEGSRRGQPARGTSWIQSHADDSDAPILFARGC